jgi:hypothetical protein
MPTALQVHESSQSSDERQRPESVDLRLPSGVPRNMWPTLAAGLIDKEKRLRVAQAHDGLAELRKMLRVTMGLWQYKQTQLGPSQRANTRARSMIERYRKKVERCADRYRSARAALLLLATGRIFENCTLKMSSYLVGVMRTKVRVCESFRGSG